MQYAKRLEYSDGVFMAGSGMSPPPMDELNFGPADYSLESLCANYGDPRNINTLAKKYDVDGTRVALTAGSSEANFFAFSVACKPRDRIIIETPGYAQFTSLASMLGCEVAHLRRRPENGFLPTIEDLREVLTDNTSMIALTNLHNPTMALMPRDLLAEIVTEAAKVDATVLVDEVYLDHLKPGENDQSAIGLGDNVVVTNSLTKVYGLGGLRFGWAIGPEDMIEGFHDLADVVDPELPQVTQNLAAKALTVLPRLRARARKLHEQNWPVVREWLESRDDVEHFAPPGGITCWVRLKNFEATGSLITVLNNDYQVLVVPGEYFQSPGWIRIGYKLAPTKVREGLARLGRALDELSKGA